MLKSNYFKGLKRRILKERKRVVPMRRRSGWRAEGTEHLCPNMLQGLCLVPVSRKTTPRKLRVSLQPTGLPSLTIWIAERELSVERAGTCLRPACLAWDVLQLARPETRLTTYLKGSS